VNPNEVTTHIPHPELSHYEFSEFGEIELAIASPISQLCVQKVTIWVHKIPQKPIVTVEGAESGIQGESPALRHCRCLENSDL